MKFTIYLFVALCFINRVYSNVSTEDRNVEKSVTSNNSEEQIGSNILGERNLDITMHYFFGEHNPRLRRIHREIVEYNAFPLMRRVKIFSYTDSKERTIRAIDCYDHRRTEASVEVIAGGVGFTYVTLQLTSAKSHGLDYAIEIFA